MLAPESLDPSYANWRHLLVITNCSVVEPGALGGVSIASNLSRETSNGTEPQ